MAQVCQRCGMPVRHGFKFCNVCGEPYADDVGETENIEMYSPLLGPQGRVVRLLNGKNAGSFFDAYPVLTIGRGDADICIDDDLTVSVSHARIDVSENDMRLTDTGSLNGIFLKVHDKIVLHDNDVILAGGHYFLFDVIEIEAFSEESGTDFYASPVRGESFRLVEILSGGRSGRACVAIDGMLGVGRCSGEFTFSDDAKMNDCHFTIRWTSRGAVLSDSSANGTYVRMRDNTRIATGDLFFVGRSLFQMF